jgi:hypothetical protein
VSTFEPDDFADLDPDDVEALEGLTDEELAAALDLLYGTDPLAGYAHPAGRPRPPAVGRRITNLPPL